MEEIGYRPKSKKGSYIVLVLAFLIIVIWALGPKLVLYWKTNNLIFNKNNWQAVYLVNGDVYIGQIKLMNDNIIELNSAYNLQITSGGQNQSQSTSLMLQNSSAKNIALIKWGFYQPLKSNGNLFINRFSVLYWENLDEGAEVVRQIKNLK